MIFTLCEKCKIKVYDVHSEHCLICLCNKVFKGTTEHDNSYRVDVLIDNQPYTLGLIKEPRPICTLIDSDPMDKEDIRYEVIKLRAWGRQWKYLFTAKDIIVNYQY